MEAVARSTARSCGSCSAHRRETAQDVVGACAISECCLDGPMCADLVRMPMLVVGVLLAAARTGGEVLGECWAPDGLVVGAGGGGDEVYRATPDPNSPNTSPIPHTSWLHGRCLPKHICVLLHARSALPIPRVLQSSVVPAFVLNPWRREFGNGAGSIIPSKAHWWRREVQKGPGVIIPTAGRMYINLCGGSKKKHCGVIRKGP